MHHAAAFCPGASVYPSWPWPCRAESPIAQSTGLSALCFCFPEKCLNLCCEPKTARIARDLSGRAHLSRPYRKLAGWYRKAADLISEIKTTWNTGGKSIGTEDDVLKKYRTAAYLALDEFHERASSDWEARTLINILDHRYDNMLATVIIANMSEAEVRAQINPSIVSRAEETGGLVDCDWASYRVKK